ncbi:MAG: type II toxin-antitoxin system VapC family toxin [Candidatus Thermoplasmatota archaeon]|nr:type II toxin-antitoxin system VapC family toxin [Candidatus Thermoplasmatota archaeon]
MDEGKNRKRFVDTNIFLYVIQGHPEFGERSKRILKRIDEKEEAVTSQINLGEICWWLEKHKRRKEIEEKIKLISSILYLEIVPPNIDDFLLASKYIKKYQIDFNDCISLAVMKRMNIDTIYSNDKDFDKTWVKREFR